ncbi:DUF4158 domain-containing protein [Nonomuraea sp. B5E05]|uniref:DUF4158 domain-containing protein n=1 Tax=Nonomuraea sp. B5E05 TaxID=3153569 RepID=UPI00326002B7
MEHDSPTLLFNLATEYLMAAKTIRPGVTTLAKMVATARTGATALTWEKVAHLLTDQLRADLDRLLMYDAGLKMTRLAWLTKAATDASATSVRPSSTSSSTCATWTRRHPGHVGPGRSLDAAGSQLAERVETHIEHVTYINRLE